VQERVPKFIKIRRGDEMRIIHAVKIVWPDRTEMGCAGFHHTQAQAAEQLADSLRSLHPEFTFRVKGLGFWLFTKRIVARPKSSEA
jgi:hypothetical protein